MNSTIDKPVEKRRRGAPSRLNNPRPTNIEIEADQRLLLDAYCAKHHISLGQVFRNAVALMLEEDASDTSTGETASE